ncbi:DNA-directed RNA polymerase IV subunit 1 [Abeliophyllum distichum]|uniref:DNA-directed RNA polymerase n=1 Tax=Abeliophyllum distichum TaxID=126358 RepID=A0ABD1TWC4_9LAMI
MDNDLDVDQQVTLGRLKGIIFNILSEEDASKISATVIGAVNEVSDPALGLPNPTTNECLTCGAKRNRECEGHFGLINLPYTILNPYFMSEVAQILNKICPGCKYLRHYKKTDSASIYHQPRNCKYCTGRLRDRYPPMKFKVSSKDMFAKTAIVAEVNEKFINNSSAKVLATDYWDVIPQESIPEESSSQANIRVLSHAQVYGILKDVSPRILEAVLRKKNSIFLNSMLVTPNSHRVREFGHRITLDESTKMYKKLIDFRGTPNELGARVLDRYKISKIRAERLSPIHRIYSENKSTNDASNTSGLKHIKELLLGKRTNHAFRMVVVGDSHIKVDEIGVPVQIAGNMLVQDHLNVWNWDRLEPCCDFMLYQKGDISVRRNGQNLSLDGYWRKTKQNRGHRTESVQKIGIGDLNRGMSVDGLPTGQGENEISFLWHTVTFHAWIQSVEPNMRYWFDICLKSCLLCAMVGHEWSLLDRKENNLSGSRDQVNLSKQQWF